ncbi:MAG: threonine synthase [Anaerolineales bacterium]
MNFVGYRCSKCGEQYGPAELIYTCPEDGSNLDVQLDYPAIQAKVTVGSISIDREHSIWRYLPLLPVEDPGYQGTQLRAVGWTPLLRSRRLADGLGLEALWLKDDGRNPTASFKDRASAVVVARAAEIGAGTLVTASTGNAGAALAGMAAAVGVPAVILAPANAPQAKVAQLLIYGAQVVLVDGNYDQAFDLSLEAAQEFGWYCRNTGYNAFTAEGKKTAAFEICEQLSSPAVDRWEAPEAVFVSVGDGNIITGLHKGFKDLVELGWIDHIPRLYGIQSTGSAAVTHAFEAGTEVIQPVQSDTIADSISVDLPRDGFRALRAVRDTGGAMIAVEDGAILEAIRTLGREAIFAEPAGAAAYAGLEAAIGSGRVASHERIVVVITGSGLKDVPAAMRAAGEATVIEPTLEALRDVVS